MDRPDFVWRGGKDMEVSDPLAIAAIAKACNEALNWPDSFSVMAYSRSHGNYVPVSKLLPGNGYYLIPKASTD